MPIEMRFGGDVSPDHQRKWRSSVAASLAGFGANLSAAIKIVARYYQAAAMYEQLARFADAELRRRGLSRATLARDVVAACSRA